MITEFNNAGEENVYSLNVWSVKAYNDKVQSKVMPMAYSVIVDYVCMPINAKLLTPDESTRQLIFFFSFCYRLILSSWPL